MADSRPPCPFCAAECCAGKDEKYQHAAPVPLKDKGTSSPAGSARPNVQAWSSVASRLASPKENVPPKPEHQVNGGRNLAILKERGHQEQRVPKSSNFPTGPPSLDTQFRQWRFPTDPSKVRSFGPGLGRFFQQALRLASGEACIMQETISLLASEGGLKIIGELVNERSFETMSNQALVRIFEAQFIPFFQTLCLKNVVASAMLEERRATICSYLFGVDGVRATVVFAAAVRYLSLMEKPSDTDANDASTLRYHATWESSLQMFATLIATKSAAHISEGIRKVVAKLSECVAAAPVPLSRAAMKQFTRVERMTARTLANVKEKTDRERAVKPTFTLAREQPGDLSQDGPRHDNDSKDIREIQIMPTLAEIQSARAEYLPGLDPAEWHVKGLTGLLDRHFRLLREDTIGQLRDAAKIEFDRLQNPAAYEGVTRRNQQGARTYVYRNLEFVGFNFDANRGLTIALAFDQPYDLKYKTATQRQDWWEASRRMGNEALVCLLAPGSVLFCVVTEQRVNHVTPIGQTPGEDGQTRAKSSHTLHSDPNRAYIVAKLVSVSDEDVKQLMGYISGDLSHTQESIVEFPGVLLPAFESTLRALQQMTASEDMPFADILSPEDKPAAEVTPPTYAMEGFSFDLSCITKDQSGLDLAIEGDMEPSVQEVADKTTLDYGQASALVSTLRHSISATQGPPGTGKTYLGIALVRALTANKKSGNLGPVLITCATNHALDQILEHLVDNGVQQIIRVGFGSRSERLSEINLSRVAAKATQTRKEREDWRTLRTEMDAESRVINELLHQISQVEAPKSIRDYLDQNYPDHANQLFGGIDDEGFETVNYGAARTLSAWLHQQGDQSDHLDRPVEQLIESNILEMSRAERRKLYQHWMEDTKGEMQTKLKLALDAYRALKDQLANVSADLNLRVLSQANVIGLTTSGLARNLNLVRRLPSRVLMVEEAAEVLEAHILTTLLPNLEHVIFIGDHQQLRPKIANYDLSCENPRGQCGLDISLFERLVTPQHDSPAGAIPLSTLGIQRRMHPSIADLVRNTLYPGLQDHASLAKYPEVVGIRKRLFWLDHNKQENPIDLHSTSHTNDWEIDMCAAIISHIVRQGVYKPSDIAVLTPYLGQLRNLRARLRKMYEILLDDRDIEDLDNEGIEEPIPKPQVTRGSLLSALRLASVDNFQGEEAKVVIVSLVRCNEQNNCGFLGTSNRINVLLSRAKHGLYVIGSSQTASSVPMWRGVLRMLQESGCIGDALELACPRHTEAELEVRESDDFLRVSPEGGCNVRCGQKMSGCDYACEASCHPQVFHDSTSCSRPCTRPIAGCISGHLCPRLCGEDCVSVCTQLITGIDVELPCGHHKTSMPCYLYQDTTKLSCDLLVTKTVPGCGHEVQVLCYENVETGSYRCQARCRAPLACAPDHACKKSCHQCVNTRAGEIEKIDHGHCESVCGKDYKDCQHKHTGLCHEGSECPPCTASIDDSCSHARSKRMCAQPYQPCVEDVQVPGFPDGTHFLPCALPIDLAFSSKRCTRQLACGHQCPSVDGECPTPYDCPTCCPDQKRRTMLQQIGANLAKDPLILPACGHAVPMSVLDSHLTINDVQQPNGSKHLLISKEIGCPFCARSMESTLRYSYATKAARLDVSTKKIHTRHDLSVSEFQERLFKEIESMTLTVANAAVPSADIRLDGTPSKQIHDILQLDMSMNSRRYEKISLIRNEIQRYMAVMQSIEQPFKLLGDRVKEKLSGQQVALDLMDRIPKVEGLYLSAVTLLAQCNLAMVTDIIQRGEKRKEVDRPAILKADFKSNRDACVHFIDEAREAKMCLIQVQGHLLWAAYAALEHRVSGESLDTKSLEAEAATHLTEARELCNSFSKGGPMAMSMDESLEAALSDIRIGGQISDVSSAVSITGLPSPKAGTWYKCVNGHPFTAGKDNVAVDEVQCYYCGEGVVAKATVAQECMENAKEVEVNGTETVADGEDLIGLWSLD